MDPLEKFLYSIAYKFSKGYPDLKDKQDVLILENEIKKLGIDLVLENQNLVNTLKQSGLFDEYGDIEASGKDTLKLVFSNIPGRGKQADQMRLDAYDVIKQLADKGDPISNFKKLATGGSSLGSAQVDFDGKTYKLIVKGASEETSSDTDVKEALVSLFYSTNIETPFNTENYQSRISQLIEISDKDISGESPEASKKVATYLQAISGESKKQYIDFINQPLSSALAIKKVYPGQKLIRTGIFNVIRNKAQALTGIPADKWCPGDLYVQLGPVKGVESADNIELLNDMFNDSWGDDVKPLTAVSLKQQEAQGGKAKALLNKYTKVKNDYNLTSDEIDFDEQQYIDGIQELRKKISSYIQGNPNIEYKLDSGNLKPDVRFLRAKYAALKSIEFLFRQFPNDQVDDAIVALAGFALSLSGINPTFFKVTGQKSGEPGKIDEFPRGQNIILYNIDGDYDPIKILDSSTFGGLKIDFTIEKGGKLYSVTINARNNGNTQGTLEIQKIQPIS
jgi:hypothetical protein